MKNLKTLKCLYRLTEQRSLSLSQAHQLLAELGDPAQYIGKKSELWGDIGYIKDEVRVALMQDTDPPNWHKIMAFIEHTPDFRYISVLDDLYPETLKNIYNPPLFLTAFGNLDLLKNPNIVSIVGTRKPTNYGKIVTEKIVDSLVENGLVVCSGLALGIDAIAHRRTLDNGGQTIAVLACGLDIIYPPQNRELARKIKETGLIISENMPYKKFEKFHFPQRNRIIAGLARATAVIEGNLRSGALITAKFALNSGSEVYALPGDILRQEAQGPNFLISKGAKPILTPTDISNDLCTEYSVKNVRIIELTDEEKAIYNLIKLNSETHIDQLVIETGMTIGELSALLFMLELKNAIRPADSGTYIACGEC